MVLAPFNFLNIIEKHEHDPCNLLFAVIVHHFGDLLYDLQSVILKVLVSELVIAQDP